MEPVFRHLDGVTDVVVGYTGGSVKNPTYEEVSQGTTGHTEAVEVTYDPTKISYEKLLSEFWINIDPIDENGQFADRGTQYRTEIFYADESQKQAAIASKAELQKKFDHKIVTQITPSSAFYAAEDYHQDYDQKNPLRYELYKEGSGRKKRLKELWKD